MWYSQEFVWQDERFKGGTWAFDICEEPQMDSSSWTQMDSSSWTKTKGNKANTKAAVHSFNDESSVNLGYEFYSSARISENSFKVLPVSSEDLLVDSGTSKLMKTAKEFFLSTRTYLTPVAIDNGSVVHSNARSKVSLPLKGTESITGLHASSLAKPLLYFYKVADQGISPPFNKNKLQF